MDFFSSISFLLILLNLNFTFSEKYLDVISSILTTLPEKEQNSKVTTYKNSNLQKTLAYITPWHGFGYDQAKKYGKNKLDFASPCWFQINQENQLQGQHDIDLKFLKELQNSPNNVKVLPRILIDMYKVKNGKLEDRNDIDKTVGKVIVETIEKYGFDGFVIECGWLAYLSIKKDMESIDKFFVPNLIKLSKYVRENYKKSKKTKKPLTIILVIPPISRTGFRYFTDQHFEKLRHDFDYFSLMTYDFQYTKHEPYYPEDKTIHPNAPLTWVKSSVTDIIPKNLRENKEVTAQILMGFNFYGRYWPTSIENALTKDGMIDFLKKLKAQKPRKEDLKNGEVSTKDAMKIKTKWFEKFSEQSILLPRTDESERMTIMFPSVRGINRRLQLANALGVGASIWEIGQGYDEYLAAFPIKGVDDSETRDEL